MSEFQADTTICRKCPLPEGPGVRRVMGSADGCPGQVDIERVGVAPTLEDRGTVHEVALSLPERYCGRQPDEIGAAIGALTTENRIVDTEMSAGIQYVIVASGPENLLTRVYGSPPPGTPRPDILPEPPELTPPPVLQIVSGATIGSVHAQLDEAVRVVVAVGLPELLEEGKAREIRLANQVDGTGNPHALAMLAAAQQIVYALRAAAETGTGFVQNIQDYKNGTGG